MNNSAYTKFAVCLISLSCILAAIGMSIKSSDGLIVDGSVTAVKSFQSYQGSLAHAGTVTLNFDGASTVNTLSITGDVPFATSNLATNRTYRVRIIGVSTNSTPTFPAWKFLGGAPSTITASRVGMLTLEAWGTTDADVLARYEETQ